MTMYQVLLTILMMIIQLKKIKVLLGMYCKNVDGVLEQTFFKVENRDISTVLLIVQNEIELG